MFVVETTGPRVDMQPALDLDLDGVTLEDKEDGGARMAEEVEERDQLLPAPAANPPPRKKSLLSRMKSKLTPKGQRSKSRLEGAGLDEATAELVRNLKARMRAADPPMDIVADAVECNARPEIAQYFRMSVEELDLVNAAPARATLVAMDKKRRMTPRSANRPNINEGDEMDLKFDGEPVTAFYYNLTKGDVEAIAKRAKEPGSPREQLAIGDVDFSFEALKAGITTRVKTYRKHLAPIDYLSIFGRASLPDLADEVSMPSPTHLI